MDTSDNDYDPNKEEQDILDREEQDSFNNTYDEESMYPEDDDTFARPLDESGNKYEDPRFDEYDSPAEDNNKNGAKHLSLMQKIIFSGLAVVIAGYLIYMILHSSGHENVLLIVALYLISFSPVILPIIVLICLAIAFRKKRREKDGPTDGESRERIGYSPLKRIEGTPTERKIKVIWICYLAVLLFTLFPLNFFLNMLFGKDNVYYGLGLLIYDCLGAVTVAVILGIITAVLKNAEKQQSNIQNAPNAPMQESGELSSESSPQQDRDLINSKIRLYSRCVAALVFCASLVVSLSVIHICVFITVLGVLIPLIITIIRADKGGQYSNKFIYAYVAIILHAILRFVAVLAINTYSGWINYYSYQNTAIAYTVIQSIATIIVALMTSSPKDKLIKLDRKVFWVLTAITIIAAFISIVFI